MTADVDGARTVELAVFDITSGKMEELAMEPRPTRQPMKAPRGR